MSSSRFWMVASINFTSHPRAVDLGCGTGATAVHLAERGHQVVGGTSPVWRCARPASAPRPLAWLTPPGSSRAISRPDPSPGSKGRSSCSWTSARWTTQHGRTPSHGGHGQASSGALTATPSDLPHFSFAGPSRITPLIHAGGEAELFGDSCDIETLSPPSGSTACFLMTRHHQVEEQRQQPARLPEGRLIHPMDPQVSRLRKDSLLSRPG